MAEPMHAIIPVFMFLVDSSQRVYLQRRYHTGYLDGYYEPPTGKVDAGEFPRNAACREALEEAGVNIEPEHTELFHSYINLSKGQPWLGLMFRTRQWQGTPSIQEPEKCDQSAFFSLDNLPLLTPQTQDGLLRLMMSPTIEMSTYTDIG